MFADILFHLFSGGPLSKSGRANVDGISDAILGRLRGKIWIGDPIVNLNELKISAIDFFYLASKPLQGGETELEQRVRRVARCRDFLPHDQWIVLDPTRPQGFAAGIDEAAEYARITFTFLSHCATMDPSALVLPATAQNMHYGHADADQLYQRIPNALHRRACIGPFRGFLESFLL